MAVLLKEARQASSIGACTLDEGLDGAQGPCPELELTIAFEADHDGQLRNARSECGDGHGGVGVLVGIDADDDIGRWALAHIACPPVGSRARRSGGWTGL